MMDDLAALLNDPNVTPEMLEKLLSLETLDDKDALLRQQMSMADMLRQPGRQYTTPGGALLGGIGDAVGQITGAYLQKKAMGEREGIPGQRVQGRMGFVELLRGQGKRAADERSRSMAERQQWDNYGLDPSILMR